MPVRFSPEVTALLDANKHPLRKEIDLLRACILEVDKSIEEGVKWNAASFRTGDWFATLNGPHHVAAPMLILHAGAKAKGTLVKGHVPDAAGLLKWMGNDRAQIVFKDLSDIKRKREPLQAIVRAWIDLL